MTRRPTHLPGHDEEEPPIPPSEDEEPPEPPCEEDEPPIPPDEEPPPPPLSEEAWAEALDAFMARFGLTYTETW